MPPADQYLFYFGLRRAALAGSPDAEFRFLCLCAFEGQSDHAMRAGVEALKAWPRADMITRFTAYISSPIVDEWVFKNALAFATDLDLPVRPVLQLGVS